MSSCAAKQFMAVTFTVGSWVPPSLLTTFATAGLPVQGLAATSLTARTVSVLSPASAMLSPPSVTRLTGRAPDGDGRSWR